MESYSGTAARSLEPGSAAGDVVPDILLSSIPRGGREHIEQFSTTGFSAEERIALWEEHNARSLVALQARTLNGVPLEATELNIQLARMQFAQVVANPHVVERDVRQIARNPTEGVALYFTLFGEAFFYHEDGVHLQKPGSLLVCDVGEPFMRGFAQGLQEFVVTVPRVVFQEISDDPVPRRPLTMSFASVPGGNAHAAKLAKLIRSTFFAPTAPLQEVEERALALLRAIFSDDGSRSNVAYRDAAMGFISGHLRDPQLSVGIVAAGVGISERHLNRVFRDSGTGVARVILERRLDLARRILADRAAPSVGEVAMQCGFASHAHFARVFRERFDETPAQMRSRAHSARGLRISDRT